MPDSIVFGDIPIGLRVPGTYVGVDGSRATNALPQLPRKLLLVGQRLAAGSVAANHPIRINAADEAADYFGQGSMLHRMAIRARNANPMADIWAIAQDDDPAGVAAVGKLTITGAATVAGTLNLYIAGQRVPVAVAKSDTATQLGPKIVAAIVARPDLPITASYASSIVTLTCRWAGETGNDIDLRVDYYQGERTPAGLGVYWMGANLLTDGCGSSTGWTLGSGWALGSSKFDKTPGTASDLTRAVTGLVVGQTYRVLTTIAGRTAGTVSLKLGSTVLSEINANVARSALFTATSTSHNISFAADATFDGSVDNLIVYPVTERRGKLGAITAGSGNPDLTDTIAALRGEWFYTWFCPYLDGPNLALLDAETADRWGPLDPRPAHVFQVMSDTHTNLTTWGETRNGIHFSTLGVYGSPTPAYEIAASWGAVIDRNAANTDPLSPFVGLEIPGMLAPEITERWDQLERQNLYYSGISGYTVDNAGVCHVDLTITNYQTNALNIEDTAFLLLNHKWGADWLRLDVRQFAAMTWRGFKIAQDGTQFDAGQKITTPRLMKGAFVERFRLWERLGMAQDVDQFKNDFRIAISENDPARVNAIIPPKMLSPLHIFAAAVQFRI